MKYLKQLLLIIIISFVGEILRYMIPLPIPASVYGFVLMFVALELKIIKVDSVKETSRFLIEIMPVMFIPAGVGLLTSVDVLKPVLVPVIVITVVSTFVVMAASGWMTQLVISFKRGKGKEEA